MKVVFSMTAALALSVSAWAAPEKVTVRVVSNQVVNDTITDAMSPTGLAVAPNGDILAAFHDRGDIGPLCKAYIVRSTDGGKTWGAPEKVFAGKNDREGISLTLHNAPDNSIYLTVTTMLHASSDRKAVYGWRSSSIEIFRSVDGKEYVPVQKLTTPSGAIFSLTGKIIELPNGDWVIPGYGYPKRASRPGEVYGAGIFRSTDKGKTWGSFERIFKDDPAPGERPYSFNETDLLLKADGTLVAFARIDSRPRCHLWKVVSADCGKTWSDPVETDIPGLYPAIIRLDNGGFLMVAGNRYAKPVIRTVNFFYSADGENFTFAGMPYYTRTDGTPANSATGGLQAIVKDPASGNYIVIFYAHDPELPGHHQCYVDSNIVEVK